MIYSNIYDMHSHSDNSFDGNHSCILLCEGALSNGGKGIAITDHLDIDGNDINDIRAFTVNQFVQTYSAKEAFKNQLEVFQGIELGQGIYKKELSEKILKDFKYDIVLGSIHNLENMRDFYFLDYRKYDIDDLLKRYFEAELELAEWNKTDSLAHLTYPLRYICGREHIKVDISRYYDIIDVIFETLINNDKALELNVSGLFGELRDTMPNKYLIKRFYDMGGRYVTIGSDSHYYDKVCLGIDKGMDILRECGFDSYTVFRQRQPVLIPIE